MFKTLMLKEILESIHDFRFLITVLLCVILIPLGMYVTLKDYEQRLSDYQDSVRLYQEHSEGKLRGSFQAEGYRPPSLLSIFSVGLEYFLPNKVVTSRDGQLKLSYESTISNPHSLLFGKIDFLFIASFVLSLLAFIFTFNLITGEKETGTIRLIMSNSVPRWQVLLAKVTGNFLVFIIPLFIGLLISVLIINVSGIFTIFSKEVFLIFIVILFTTLLFIFSMFNLGILVSTFTHRSIISVITLLFVWVIFMLVIPKTSPMIAQIIHPVKSQQVINIEKRNIRENLENELRNRKKGLLENILSGHGFEPRITMVFGKSEKEKQALIQYDETVKAIEEEYQERINRELRKIEDEYINEQNVLATIAVNLSRISPISCFTYILSEISGTGLTEIKNFKEYASRFQEEVKDNIYDKFKYKIYIAGDRAISRSTRAEEFNPNELHVPHINNYKHITLEETIKNEWVDIVLLVLYNILFFAASYLVFIRYDVR